MAVTREVLIDLANVATIASGGLGGLVSASTTANRRGAKRHCAARVLASRRADITQLVPVRDLRRRAETVEDFA